MRGARCVPWQTALGFFAIYVAFTALSLPAAALMTLLAGAIFGLFWGVVLVSFASAIGATLALLASRFVLRDWVQARFGAQLRGINRGVEREGAFYLFALRLVPAVPFFLINLAMGLTPIRTWTFYWVSQLGMLPGTRALRVRRHAARAARFPARDPVVAAARRVRAARRVPAGREERAGLVKARRVYARWRKPRRFDRNLVVIGAGSAGLVAAYIAAAVRAR